MPNRLASETSPYLLQHKDNPVDWYPWGDDALSRARDEDKPILVSIGYSSCHWCHVMEHESFEDADVAAYMNEHFVPIKVDREERPDVDAIYMEACQAMTGQGGWPLHVFLTPDQIGGGFARYAVDAHWLVPHFEKMLYDNALLARTYLHAWQALGDDLFKRVTTETLDWALREMRGPEGGFYSALDADSEGVEGRFYVWSLDELREVLGDDADAAIEYFGATGQGNFEGRNILTRGERPPERLDEIRRRLYEARAERVWPGLDD